MIFQGDLSKYHPADAPLFASPREVVTKDLFKWLVVRDSGVLLVG